MNEGLNEALALTESLLRKCNFDKERTNEKAIEIFNKTGSEAQAQAYINAAYEGINKTEEVLQSLKNAILAGENIATETILQMANLHSPNTPPAPKNYNEMYEQQMHRNGRAVRWGIAPNNKEQYRNYLKGKQYILDNI